MAFWTVNSNNLSADNLWLAPQSWSYSLVADHWSQWMAVVHGARVLLKCIQQTFQEQQQDYSFLLIEQVRDYNFKKKPKWKVKDPCQTNHPSLGAVHKTSEHSAQEGNARVPTEATQGRTISFQSNVQLITAV